MEVTTPDELVQDVAGLPEPTPLDSDDDENENLENVFSVEKQLMSLAVTKTALKRHASMTSEVLKAFTKCQRTLRHEEQRSLSQKNIQSFSVEYKG